jgi:hypothetical protein
MLGELGPALDYATRTREVVAARAKSRAGCAWPFTQLSCEQPEHKDDSSVNTLLHTSFLIIHTIS